MSKKRQFRRVTVGAGISLAAALVAGLGVGILPASSSSHREAPLISEDPVADNTDT